jgi:hypothetical protein
MHKNVRFIFDGTLFLVQETANKRASPKKNNLLSLGLN